jgi:simple sugar transport system ATP-binding protein
MTTSAPPFALELVGIAKRFGAAVALDGATLAVRAGTVHALLGENGAGKTTLMRVAFGMVRPDAGVVRVDGRERHFASPADAIAAGLGMVHQHFALVPAMTVAENVALGGRGRFAARAAAERVREVSRRAGLVLDPDARVDTLSVGAQQRLEIVKALARDARVLILDEPTAVLAPAESAELLAWARDFAAGGGSVVLITHKLREVLAAADEVTVLRRGSTVATVRAADASESALAAAMLGTAVADAPGGPPRAQHRAVAADTRNRTVAPIMDPPRPSAPAAVRLAAHAITVADDRGVVRLRDATCEVRGGEIVGVAGVEGGGQRELLRALAGRAEPRAGRVERPSRVGFVPEDRHRDALLLDFSLVENVALRDAGRRRGVVDWRRLARTTAELLARHDVRAPGPDAPAAALSGGNQQKLVLARELSSDLRAPGDVSSGAPAALVVENPTRGLDIRASAAVHDRLREARDAGTAVVVYSSDLDEVLALADRVLACYAGRLREVPREREAVGRAILGLDAAPAPTTP